MTANNTAANGTAENKPLLYSNSSGAHVTPTHVYAQHTHRSSAVTTDAATGRITALAPHETVYSFRTDTTVPKLGLMMVGWGGNNGTTVTAAVLANRHRMSWQTRTGTQQANFYGSMMMASTTRVGTGPDGRDVHVPIASLLPLVNPCDLILGGWDISSDDLATGMRKAQVLEPDLQRQVSDAMAAMRPLPSIYDADFIAQNQRARADNLITGTKRQQLDRIRQDIREFKAKNALDKVIVLWTATTERYAQVIAGVNDTADCLLKAIDDEHGEIAPSTLFAVASILEQCPYINGSPQNTFVPGVQQLALRHQSPIAGDDFKSGQTKLKSVLADFLVSAGIKPLAITSYNHLGNNDGLNLSEDAQFRSKEVSKRSVVDDVVDSNPLLYSKGEHPDHTIVIKYVPAVGDSKRAMDEYYSEIMMGGRNTLAIHNTCEDSLLAAPLILDLTVLAELLTRIQVSTSAPRMAKEQLTGVKYDTLPCVYTPLSYFLKAPLADDKGRVVNALGRQRAWVENLMRACIGIHAEEGFGF